MPSQATQTEPFVRMSLDELCRWYPNSPWRGHGRRLRVRMRVLLWTARGRVYEAQLGGRTPKGDQCYVTTIGKRADRCKVILHNTADSGDTAVELYDHDFWREGVR